MRERKPHLLKGFDCSASGYYFITICTHRRKKLFGDVIDGKMILNEAGKVAHECWMAIPLHNQRVVLEDFVIMPDHVHGIIRIPFDPIQRKDPANHEFGKVIPNSIGQMIKGFKIGVTTWYRRQNIDDEIWRPRYHCRIISERAVGKVNDYIRLNPENFTKR